MGRRALRKIDPNIDLSFHFLTVEQLPDVCDSQRLFQNDLPLQVEVGSGKGLFMSNASVSQPEHNFLGIEVAGKYCRMAAARLARRGAKNARMIHGDAMVVFRDRLPDHSLAAVHVYFPDPWWKKRHRKRRIMNEAFLKEVVRVLRPAGELHFWTDVKEYFDVTLQLVDNVTPLLGPTLEPAREAAHHLDYRTHFERRMRLHDQPVYRARYTAP